MTRPPPSSPLFPYTTLFRSRWPQRTYLSISGLGEGNRLLAPRDEPLALEVRADLSASGSSRSEEHTSELQSQSNLVCRLLLEKKKKALATPDDERTITFLAN